jgi:hypothetical protein
MIPTVKMHNLPQMNDDQIISAYKLHFKASAPNDIYSVLRSRNGVIVRALDYDAARFEEAT